MNSSSKSRSGSNDADVPESLRRITANQIEIQWHSGVTLRYTAQILRDACPCATCRERRRGDEPSAPEGRSPAAGLPILSAAEAQPLTIDAVTPVGNYAYNVTFGDGHHSGIYTLGMLRQIGRGAE